MLCTLITCILIITYLTYIIHAYIFIITGAKGKITLKTAYIQGKKVPPRFELGLPESEPDVITTYTMGPCIKLLW